MEELNNFFETVVASLDIYGNWNIVENVEDINYPVDKAIKKIERAKTFLKIYFVLMK